MHRFTLIAACVLVACSLEVPGSGPLEIDPLDPVDGAPASSGSAGVSPVVSAPAPGSAPNAPVVIATDAGSAVGAGSPAIDAGVGSSPATMPPARPASDASTPANPANPMAGTFSLHSPAFQNGDRIPAAFTCEGGDQSPPLVWENAPAGTRSFALVLTSKSAWPGAALEIEWVLWNISASAAMLPKGVAQGEQPSNVPGASQFTVNDGPNPFTGTGSWGGNNFVAGGGLGAGGPGGNVSGAKYEGPCFSNATYEFKLFALDTSGMAPWGDKTSAETIGDWLTMRSHVLADATLSGVFP